MALPFEHQNMLDESTTISIYNEESILEKLHTVETQMQVIVDLFLHLYPDSDPKLATTRIKNAKNNSENETILTTRQVMHTAFMLERISSTVLKNLEKIPASKLSTNPQSISKAEYVNEFAKEQAKEAMEQNRHSDVFLPVRDESGNVVGSWSEEEFEDEDEDDENFKHELTQKLEMEDFFFCEPHLSPSPSTIPAPKCSKSKMNPMAKEFHPSWPHSSSTGKGKHPQSLNIDIPKPDLNPSPNTRYNSGCPSTYPVYQEKSPCASVYPQQHQQQQNPMGVWNPHVTGVSGYSIGSAMPHGFGQQPSVWQGHSGTYLTYQQTPWASGY